MIFLLLSWNLNWTLTRDLTSHFRITILQRCFIIINFRNYLMQVKWQRTNEILLCKIFLINMFNLVVYFYQEFICLLEMIINFNHSYKFRVKNIFYTFCLANYLYFLIISRKSPKYTKSINFVVKILQILKFTRKWKLKPLFKIIRFKIFFIYYSCILFKIILF